MYHCALEQVLENWPEYEALRNLIPPTSETTVVDTLHQVYSRILDQHRHIKYLLDENRELRQNLGEIEEELKAQVQMMKRRDFEMQQLRTTLEMQPRRHSGKDSESDGRRNPVTRTGSTYRPTPLVQAEGPDGISSVVRRHSSGLTPLSAHRDNLDRRNSLSANFGRTYELAETVTRLQRELDEGRRESHALRQRYPWLLLNILVSFYDTTFIKSSVTSTSAHA